MRNERITIDLGIASTKRSLHELFAAMLGFPGYYGMNWDAFWDCVRDDEQSSLPKHLQLRGMSLLEQRLPDDALKLRKVVDDLRQRRPELSITLEA